MTNLPDSHPTDLEFKDQRDYVHSTTLVEHLLQIIESHYLPSEKWVNPVVSARFHRLAKTNGRFVFFDAFPAETGQAPASDFKFELGEAVFFVHYYDESIPVERRVPSCLDIRSPRLAGNFAGAAEIGSPDRRTWVESLIELNKQIHLMTLGEIEKKPQVLNLYMKRLPLRSPSQEAVTTVTLENVGVRSHGDSVATLNRLLIEGCPGRCEISYVLEGVSQEQLSQ